MNRGELIKKASDPITELLLRDVRTVEKDARIQDFIAELDPSIPKTIAQIAREISTDKKSITPSYLCQRIIALTAAGRFDQKDLLRKIDLYELFEDPEMSTLANDHEPENIIEALNIYEKVSSKRERKQNQSKVDTD